MKEIIGDHICHYRQLRKLTQEEFAARLGVTPQAVSKWERGSGLPDISLVEGICNILKIDANLLLGVESSQICENQNAAAEKEIRNNLTAEPLVLEFGEELAMTVASADSSDPESAAAVLEFVMNYVNQKRKDLARKAGMLLPLLRLRDNLSLSKSGYRILCYDRVLEEGTADILLAQSANCSEQTPNVKSPEKAVWMALIDRVSEICEANYAAVLNKQIVKTMVDGIKESYPGIADGLVPERLSYLRVERKLQDILSKGGSIRNFIHILEELEEEADMR